MKDLKFIMKYSKPYAYKVFAILIDVIIYVTGLLVAPLILSYMIDNIIHGIPIEQGIVAVAIDALGGVDFLRNNLWIAKNESFACGGPVGGPGSGSGVVRHG